MAMDALKNLTTNIPDWQTRLDELSGQVERRQAELAAVAAADPNAEARSLRNKGSTESLKPKDDGPSQIADPDVTPAVDLPEEAASPFVKPSTPPQDTQRHSNPSPGAVSPSALQRPVNGVPAAHSRARAQAQGKRRQRSSSVVSAEGIPAYRTRSMIIVYYDSYVQGFFDDLVRFVSSSRNLMRKAKMAAKVAQIKRMAEMEMPDGDNSSDEKSGADALPSLRYMSSRRFGPMSALSRPGFGPGADQVPDVYDNLDKSLEFVQGTCEHGAHQFLRDADCNDEIKKIQKRMAEVLDMAAKEMERVQREEPELAKETGDVGRVRTRRPISMRRGLSATQKDASKDETAKLEAAVAEDGQSPLLHTTGKLEVDTSIEADEGIEADQDFPKLQYRSTRNMRPRIS